MLVHTYSCMGYTSDAATNGTRHMQSVDWVDVQGMGSLARDRTTSMCPADWAGEPGVQAAEPSSPDF